MSFPIWSDIHASWQPILAPVASQLETVIDHIQHRRNAGEPIEPQPEHVLRVFRMPFDEVRVLIIGQDPYPTPGHAVGLSFSMHPAVRPIARSLVNIFQELRDDVGIPPAASGDLSAWEAQGVFLLNRVLTVTAHEAGSHSNLGWETITETAVQALAARDAPLVAILWGGQARRFAPMLASPTTLVLESAHPSPLSAHRGFFGSRPFSQTNAFLGAQGQPPINWSTAPHQAAEQPELF